MAAGTVGAFTGAFYNHCGAYRPEFDCKMRTLSKPFCSVCQNRIAVKLNPYAPLGDFPQPNSNTGVGGKRAIDTDDSKSKKEDAARRGRCAYLPTPAKASTSTKSNRSGDCPHRPYQHGPEARILHELRDAKNTTLYRRSSTTQCPGNRGLHRRG